MTDRKLFIFVLLSFIFTISISLSQDFDINGKPIVKFSSPYNTVFVHLQYLNKEFYNPKIAGKVFNIKNNTDSAAVLAIKLKRIYDGNGLIVNMARIPRDENYIDTSTGLNRFVLFRNFPDIYLEKFDKNWYYSAHTTRIINVLYSEMYPYSIDELVNNLPNAFKIQFIYLELWQWTGFAAIILLSFIFYLIFNKIIVYLLIKLWKRILNREVDSVYLHKLSKPIGFLIFYLTVDKLIPLLELPITISYYINLLIQLSIPVLITFIIYRVTNYISELIEKFALNTESKLDDKIVLIVRKFLKIIIIVFGGLYIIKNTGLDITPLLAGVSIGSLALALAAQETIKNIFGSITLFSDKVFEPGDWIIAEDVDGSVEEVGIRSTRIRTANNSLIIVPNGRLANMNINNMGKRQFKRFNTVLKITYNTSTTQINDFILGLKDIVANHPNTKKDYDRVALNNLGDFSIQILFDTFLDVPDYVAELKARQEIITDIIKLAESLSIEFAFPTQTIYIDKP